MSKQVIEIFQNNLKSCFGNDDYAIVFGFLFDVLSEREDFESLMNGIVSTFNRLSENNKESGAHMIIKVIVSIENDYEKDKLSINQVVVFNKYHSALLDVLKKKHWLSARSA